MTIGLHVKWRGVIPSLATIAGIGAAVLVIMGFAPDSFSFDLNVVLVSLLACSLVIYLFAVQRYGAGGWLSLGNLFNLSYVIVVLLIPLMDLAGYSVLQPFEAHIWSSYDVRNRAMGTAVLGLVCFHFGTLASFVKAVARPSIEGNPIALRGTGLTLLVLAAYASFFAWIITSGSMIKGEYTPDDASAASSYFYKLFKVFFSALIIARVTRIWHAGVACSLKGYVTALGRPTLLMLIAFVALAGWIGDRGPLIYFLVLSFGLYFIRFQRTTFVRAVVVVLIAASALSILGQVRQSRHGSVTYSERLVLAVEDGALLYGFHRLYGRPVPFASFVELGSSVRTLNHAIANVPSSHSHTLGLFQFVYISSVIPGVSAPLSKVLFDSQAQYGTSSNFVTYLIQGNFPKYGDGTSVVADLYIDFGVAGVAIGLFLFGVFAGRADQALRGRGAAGALLWVASLVYFANSLYLARSALLLELSNVILIYFAIMLARGVGNVIPPSSPGARR